MAQEFSQTDDFKKQNKNK